MACVSFKDLPWVLLIILVLVPRDSLAYSQPPVVESTMRTDGYGHGVTTTGENLVSVNHEELFGGAPAAAAAFRKQRVGGRKMVVNKVMMKKKIILKEEELRREHTSSTQHPPKNELNADCKLNSRNLLPEVKVNYVGFIAFSADYHVPKPHPPKNN